MGTTFERSSMKELTDAMRTKILDLEAARDKQESVNSSLRSEYDQLKLESQQLAFETEKIQRTMEIEIDDMERKHRYEIESMTEKHSRDMERMTSAAGNDLQSAQRETREQISALQREHNLEVSDLVRKHQNELQDEKARRATEVEELARQRDAQIEKIATSIGNKEREADSIRDDLTQKIADLERERTMRAALELQLQQKITELFTMTSKNQAIEAQIDFLESNNQQQSSAFATLHRQTQEAVAARDEAIEKLRAEETLRRKLHNQVQELKGNIRVFCRVRPTLEDEEEENAKIKYPDLDDEAKEVVIFGAETKSALGNVTRPQHPFSFDRVFGPSSTNGEIFDEISQLIQSALDGYNVCIFCYGQTGSGKTYTMSSSDGMIPRAVRQIYGWAKALEEKGWSYKMEGSFVEVYNENLNDLLGRAEEFDKKKHEIRHDMQKMKTTITDVTIMPLDSPEAVEGVLNRADRNRSVAATKANQRSSRSHSVFILTLVGENSITGERSEGTLNLVDLAGSERLAHSQAEGQRLKETQNINKSLSCLGDVIGALGRGDSGHIPYRNSKLTYLLQHSLGGNSKTLMFVMISPLQAHLSETVTSLKFATKVHNTHIGTAKRQNKVKD
ncbi:carboxy-terminal kinesin 2 [Microthyrium microscopicum]|uniref:Kinesin-like protein n=1 Tax=Microthyrium microscopicum TaxID=703497 RepID=A0A6A6UQK6_9PEZI|nr:carboxy-terminal kinesin 2 [Microthyrium microscopicum]